MTQEILNSAKDELSIKAKNGIDFTMAASIIWLAIAFIWQQNYPAYQKSIWIFIIGAPMLPLAYLFSKIIGTQWNLPNNPLQSLGLWLNFSQLFYFPFLVFTMIKVPEYFIMTYAIITGAHLFPFGWFYRCWWYTVFAGMMGVGTLILALLLPIAQGYFVGFFMSFSFVVLTALLIIDYKKKIGRHS